MRKTQVAWLLSGWVLIQTGAAGFAGFGWLSSRPAERLPTGYSCGSIALGDLQPDVAAERILAEPMQAGVPATIRLRLDDAEFTLAGEAIGLRIDEAALSEVLKDRLPGSRWNRMLGAFSSAGPAEALRIPLPLIVDEANLNTALEGIAAEWDRLPVDAQPHLSEDSLQVDSEIPGRRLDAAGLTGCLTERLAAAGIPEAGALVPELASLRARWMKDLAPEIPASVLTAMVRTGKAEVSMADGFENDAAIAAETMQPYLLEPGKTLDMLFWLAPALERFSSEDSPSRAATAVHSAILASSGITVIERHPAPFAANYAPPGQEAVVGGTMGNLLLRNDMDKPMLLMTEEKEGAIRVATFAESNAISATVFSDVVETSEPPIIYSMTRDLPPGETRVIAQGSAGMKVNVYRLDGEGKVLIHSDAYPAQNRILEMGMEKSGSGAVVGK